MNKLLFAVVVTEAVTEILVDSHIFSSAREFLSSTFPRLLKVFVNCGFCVSVWIGVLVSYLFWIVLPFESFIPVYAQPLLVGVVVHRLSNIFHGLVNCVVGAGRICIDRVFAIVREVADE